MNQQNSEADGAVAGVQVSSNTKILYKCDTCNSTYSDKVYFDLHKQSHEQQKDYPVVQIVMSSPQVIPQSSIPQGSTQVVIPEDQLAMYRRNYVDTQQVYSLAPVTQYQMITPNHSSTPVTLSQPLPNISNLTYVVPSNVDPQFHNLSEALIQPEHLDNQIISTQQIIQQPRLSNHMQVSSNNERNSMQLNQSFVQNVAQNPPKRSRIVVNNPKDRPFKCRQCTASFIERDELDEHRKKHTDDGPFTCEECHFTFMYKSHFKSHKTRCIKRRAMMAEGGSSSPIVINPSSVKREFPSNASEVNTSKLNNPPQYQIQANVVQSQQVHYQTKTNGANFPSKQTTFRTKQHVPLKFNPSNPSFKRIKRESRLDRPYECSECDASFQSEVDLKNHSVKHTGDGPYTCDDCKFVFLYRKLYEAHKRRCDKNKKSTSVTNVDISNAITNTIDLDANSTILNEIHDPQIIQAQQQVDTNQFSSQEIMIGNHSLGTSIPQSSPAIGSSQSTVIDVRNNGQNSQDVQQTVQVQNNAVFEPIMVTPGTPLSSILGNRPDVKYEIVPIPAGLIDFSDGVLNMNQIMNLIKLKGSNQ